MRVLMVAHGFPPRATGGAELYAETHARTLAARGDRVLVLTRESDSTREEFAVRREQRDGLDVVWVNNTFAATRTFADTWTDDRVDAIAAGVIDEFKPDVAHVHHLTCLSTSIVFELSSRGIPIFCTLHDYWLLCHRGQLLDRDLKPCAGPSHCDNCLGPEASLPAIAYAARQIAGGRRPGLPPSRKATADRTPADARRTHMRRVMAAVTLFFAPSTYLRDRFIAAGVDPACITVSEYGWRLPEKDLGGAWGQTPKFRGLTPPHPGGPLRFGFIGSVMVSKALHLLVEAAAELPPGTAEVHIFGGHADYHGDRSYRQQLGPLLRREYVRYHGPIDRAHLQATLAGVDVLVVPSIWPENSPLVIREAFLAGVPVVASRIGGIPETVTDGVNGLLFEPGSARDLARALRQLIDDPGLLARLARASPQIRTVDDDVTSMRSVYAAALAAPQPPRRRIAAVVLNYRTPADTFLATRSLFISRRPLERIFVVDNSEDDECRTTLAQFDGRITYIRTGSNLGFSGGMNAGIEQALGAGADAVLLVNSDVVVPVESIGAIERALYSTPGAGIAGPAVVGRTAPDRVASLGIDYNDTTGRMRHRGVSAPVATVAPGASHVAAVSGCLMLVKREVFAAAGMLDPRFFFSFEDVDFCLRARDAGFSSIVAAGAIVLHEGGRTMGTRTPRRFYFGARNQLLVASRRGGRGAAAFRSMFIVALNVAHALRAPGGSLGGRLRAVARGTRDFLAGRFGED
ncbi:MAG TPA: glycosyltransferase [Vicinamibacterales bacterium]|nr:glycosyltransferase [Vicinamibacterales bacterium]